MIKYKHLDANESALFYRALNFVMGRVYEIRYPNLKARQLIPVNTSIPAGAETVTYDQYDVVGMAKIVANYADDIPRVDLKGQEFVGRIRSAADAYGYSLQEVRAAALQGLPLATRKADVAKRALLQLENKIAFKGDASHGLQGMINAPNISSVTLPADGTGSATTFASKTPSQILRDLNAAPNFIVTSTFEVETADTLLLPLAQYLYIASTPFSTVGYDGTTILQMFLRNSTYIKTVESLPELKGAGAGATDRMIAYRKDPIALELLIPQDFEQLEVDQRNLEFVVPCHMRVAGVAVYLPLSVCYADGI